MGLPLWSVGAFPGGNLGMWNWSRKEGSCRDCVQGSCAAVTELTNVEVRSKELKKEGPSALAAPSTKPAVKLLFCYIQCQWVRPLKLLKYPFTFLFYLHKCLDSRLEIAAEGYWQD